MTEKEMTITRLEDMLSDVTAQTELSYPERKVRIYALLMAIESIRSDNDLEQKAKLCETQANIFKSQRDKLAHELDKLHTELEKAKNPQRYIEVLLSDGLPAVRIENGAYFRWTDQEEQLVIYNKSDKITAVFNDEHVVGIIKRGKWENDED